jgi:hypothetical protein
MNEHVECVKLLLEYGADVNIRNTYGFLPKDLASKNKQIAKLVDSFVPKSNVVNTDVASIKTVKRKQKRICIFGTGMNDEDKAKLNRFTAKLDLIVSKEMSNNVTHVIYKSENKICQRTINYMKSVLLGLWILSDKCKNIFTDFTLIIKKKKKSKL